MPMFSIWVCVELFFFGETSIRSAPWSLRRRRCRKSCPFQELMSPSKKSIAWPSSKPFHGLLRRRNGLLRRVFRPFISRSLRNLQSEYGGFDVAELWSGDAFNGAAVKTETIGVPPENSIRARVVDGSTGGRWTVGCFWEASGSWRGVMGGEKRLISARVRRESAGRGVMHDKHSGCASRVAVVQTADVEDRADRTV
jgi:hypothetical protein